MDERTVEMSADYTQREVQRKIDANKRTREFTVLVDGKNGYQMFSFVADTRQECADKMTEEYTVDLVKDKWAVGYLIASSGAPMVYGNDVTMEQRLETILRSKR